MNESIKLVVNVCVKIMALPLGLGAVNDSDGPLQKRFLQGGAGLAAVPKR
jgi:hypothetical protein